MIVCEDVQKHFVHFVGMLEQEIVILDFEGFRYKKTGFIIKELLLCSNNYSDTILFLQPFSYNSLSASDRRSHKWVTKFLHGLSWNSGTYRYSFLSQIFVAIKLRFPLGKFYAKGKEKTEKILNCQLIISLALCTLSTYQKSRRGKIVLKEKHSCIFIGSTCHPMSRRVGKAAQSVLQVNLSSSLTVCSYIRNDNQLTLNFFKRREN